MKLKKATFIVCFTIPVFMLITGFELPSVKDLGGSVKDAAKDCKEDKQDCAKKVIAVTAAVALIAEMVINAKSERKKTAEQVRKEYLEKNKALPKAPKLVSFDVKLDPEKAPRGSKVSFVAEIVVVSGINKNPKIEQILQIYDAEKPGEILKSARKVVNTDDNESGKFTNQFSFTMPKGMPEGLYPLATELLIDGKSIEAKKSKMQLVMGPGGTMTLASASR